MKYQKYDLLLLSVVDTLNSNMSGTCDSLISQEQVLWLAYRIKNWENSYSCIEYSLIDEKIKELCIEVLAYYVCDFM